MDPLDEFRRQAAEAEAMSPELPPEPAAAPEAAPERPRLPRRDLAATLLPALERSPLGLNRVGAAVLLAQLDRELGPELLYMTRDELLAAAAQVVARAFVDLG